MISGLLPSNGARGSALPDRQSCILYSAMSCFRIGGL